MARQRRKSCASPLPRRAFDTPMIRRVSGQASNTDEFAAGGARTEFAIVDPLQCLFDPEQARGSSTHCLLGHGLHLHGIHASQAPDALLVQFDWRGIGSGLSEQRLKLDALLYQTESEMFTEGLVFRLRSPFHR